MPGSIALRVQSIVVAAGYAVRSAAAGPTSTIRPPSIATLVFLSTRRPASIATTSPLCNKRSAMR
jgi:hypothetical protein